MRRRLLVQGLVLVGLLASPAQALADNCSSPSDCFFTILMVLVIVAVLAALVYLAIWGLPQIMASVGFRIALRGLGSALARTVVGNLPKLHHGFRHVNTIFRLGNWSKASSQVFQNLVYKTLTQPHLVIRGHTMSRGGKTVDIFIRWVQGKPMAVFYNPTTQQFVTAVKPGFRQFLKWLGLP